MSPRLTIRQKYPQLYAHDSTATPAQISVPERRGDVVELLGLLQRELLYARRQADLARVHAGKRPLAWVGAPRYAKLRHRPLVFGSSPMRSSRSSVPFDDATGDGLAKRWGVPGGFHQLMGCVKLANLYPIPVADMPLDARTEQVRQDLLDAHVQSGLFTDRVVVLVGHEALRAFGYDLEQYRDRIGPLPRQLVPGAREVLAMPDPHRSLCWQTEERRIQGRLVIVRALLAARLPVGIPLAQQLQPMPRLHTEQAAVCASWLAAFTSSEAFKPHAVAATATDAWKTMTGQDAPDLGALVRGPAVAMWRELCRIGLAPPRDLGSGAWWFDSATSASTLYLDKGIARVVGGRGQPKACTLLRHDDTVVEEATKPERSDGLRWAENAAATMGWEHPFVALDKRLTELRGAP